METKPGDLLKKQIQKSEDKENENSMPWKEEIRVHYGAGTYSAAKGYLKTEPSEEEKVQGPFIGKS